jgi:hypothetical protein
MSDKSKRPKMRVRLKNFKKALKKRAGNRTNVSKEEYAARAKACITCNEFDKDAKICNHDNCGCYITIKAWWTTEDCPLDKWPKRDSFGV